MNKTKKMTQGAMLLAILGALVLIDRITAYWFTEFVVLVAPIIVIMYSGMYTVKDGGLLSVGIAILCFIIGNFNTVYLIYIPVGIITGLVYSFGLSKGLSKTKLLLLAIITYTLGEVVSSFIVYPVLGFPIAQQLTQINEMFDELKVVSGLDYAETFETIGLNFSSLISIIFVISILIVGAMEGVIIHLLSVFLLKRFKIKDIGRTNLLDIKPNPTLAYICFISLFSIFFEKYINNEALRYILIVVAMLGSIVLLFYGYIFLVIYGQLVLHKNIAPIVVLLAFIIPILLFALIVVGFLYAAGPFRSKIDEALGKKNE